MLMRSYSGWNKKHLWTEELRAGNTFNDYTTETDSPFMCLRAH